MGCCFIPFLKVCGMEWNNYPRFVTMGVYRNPHFCSSVYLFIPVFVVHALQKKYLSICNFNWNKEWFEAHIQHKDCLWLDGGGVGLRLKATMTQGQMTGNKVSVYMQEIATCMILTMKFMQLRMTYQINVNIYYVHLCIRVIHSKI